MKSKTPPKKRGPKGPSKWTLERLDQFADELLEWSEPKANLLLSKFCADKGLHPCQITEFSVVSSKFSEAVKTVKAKEACFLEQCCLFESLASPDGKFRKVNTTGAIFLLKNNHKYTDSRESADLAKIGSNIVYHLSTKNFADSDKDKS